MARVTLIDVARHCGVSRATVSLVLNDSPLVATKTRDRVRQAMSELGYVYNRAAASLRTQHSDAIGVVLTNITNPYFAEFASRPPGHPDQQRHRPTSGSQRGGPRPAAAPGQITCRTQRGWHCAGTCSWHHAGGSSGSARHAPGVCWLGAWTA